MVRACGAYRDVDTDFAGTALTALRSKLVERQCGLHVSEIPGALGLLAEAGAQVAHSFLAVAEDHGIQLDRGQYAYLSESGTSRRVSALEATRTALLEISGDQASFDQIAERVCELTERDIPRDQVSQALQALDAEHDALRGTWKPGGARQGELAIDEEIA